MTLKQSLKPLSEEVRTMEDKASLVKINTTIGMKITRSWLLNFLKQVLNRWWKITASCMVIHLQVGLLMVAKMLHNNPLIVSYQPVMSLSSRRNLKLMSRARSLYPMKQVLRGKVAVGDTNEHHSIRYAGCMLQKHNMETLFEEYSKTYNGEAAEIIRRLKTRAALWMGKSSSAFQCKWSTHGNM